jgi:phosphatidylglycerophosphatase A
MEIRKTVVKSLSTFFYVGFLPFMPGTFGSLSAILIYYFIKDNYFIYIASTIGLIALGFLVTSEAEKIFNRKDSSYIVIDEVSGMLLSLIFIPYDVKLVIVAFIIFRILDTLKPYPCGSFQELKGSVGVMGDDIIAALYTNIVLQIVLRLASFKIS